MQMIFNIICWEILLIISFLQKSVYVNRLVKGYTKQNTKRNMCNQASYAVIH